MTTPDTFGRDLSRWLHEESEHRVPDHLSEVLVQTAATRQRPWWSSPERWLSMQATARFAPAAPRLYWLVLVGVVVGALIAAALLAGLGRPRLPAPFGPARNGDFVFSANGDIYRFDPADGSMEPLVIGESWDFGAAFSRDGTRLAFGRGVDPATVTPGADPGFVIALADADGTNVHEVTDTLLGNCWSDWSPDGRFDVFRTERPGGYGLLNVLDIERGTVETIDPGISVRCGPISYRPPTGAEIIFRGDSGTTHGVFAIHPDGTGFRQVNKEFPTCDCDTGLISPDGRYLVVDRWSTSGVVGMWLLDLETGDERRLPMPSRHFARGGTFSPDGTMIAFPMLHGIAPNQNAYQVAIAPIEGTENAQTLGPEIELPANGSDESFVSITFTPDGQQVIAAYPDDPASTNNTIWLLPIDGSPGREIGGGTFASLDIQRLAP